MFSRTKTAIIFWSTFVLFSCQTIQRNPTQAPPRLETTPYSQQDLPPVNEDDRVNRDADPPAEPKYYDRLSSYTPFNYEVLFTDPECGVYKYKPGMNVKSFAGKILEQKPENVYCKNKYDLHRSGSRKSSPQYRLVEWINNPLTTEIFFTYLSFRNKTVKNALCEAAKRGVKVRFVMSSTEDKTIANELVACAPNNVQMKARGMEGGLGYAHNKFFIINPNSGTEFKISFSSGNMTSGPVIHHENWNFVTTSPDSHFAQSHLCAMNAEWDDSVGRSRDTYVEAIRSCRQSIKAPEEKDIKVFFVPGEGEPEPGVVKKTASEFMNNGDGEFPGIMNAKKIWIGCHRFLYSKMIRGLKDRMAGSNKPELRIVADDDTFYKANDPSFAEGDTMPEEWFNMEGLAKRGAQVKLMETNSAEHQLHHSKYLIFSDANGPKAVLTGSANLTGAAFKTNWENTYYIMIPTVAKAFADHYEYTWNTLATSPRDLPEKGSVAEFLEEEPLIKKTGATNDK